MANNLAGFYLTLDRLRTKNLCSWLALNVGTSRINWKTEFIEIGEKLKFVPNSVVCI